MGLVTGLVVFDRTAIGFLYPVIVPELGLQMWQVGAITSAFSLTWSFSGWSLGSISDLVGRRAIFIPAVAAFSILSSVTGVTSSFVQVILARAAVGAAGAPTMPVGQALVIEESTPTRRGINGGAIAALAPLTGMTLGPIITVHLASTVGWRWSFFLVGIPGLVLALVLTKFLREPASTQRRRTASGKGELLSVASYVEMLRIRNVRLAVVYNSLAQNYLWVFTSFAMLYLTGVRALSMATSGVAMASFGVGGFLGSVIVPAISDYVGRKPTAAAFTSLAGISLLAFVAAGENLALVFICLLCSGFCFGALTVPYTAAMESVPPNWAASAIAVVGAVGSILGSTICPTIAGALADLYGNTVPIFVAAVGAVVAGVISLFIRETAPKVLARQTANQVGAVQPRSDQSGKTHF